MDPPQPPQPQKTLEQRMDAFVRKCAMLPAEQRYSGFHAYDEARSIVTELDRAKQDDADLAMAREACVGLIGDPAEVRDGGYDSNIAVQSALAAIRLMREKGNG